jgi:hypothetical protein
MPRPRSSIKGGLLTIHFLLLWRNWLDRNIFDLARQMRLSYVPPLTVYLAALSFWVMLPWALKMPLGHLVDLLWRYKASLIYVGASLIAASLLIMANLLADLDYMTHLMPAEDWYILASLLAPVGYVMLLGLAIPMLAILIAKRTFLAEQQQG